MQLQQLFEKVTQLVTVTFEAYPSLTYTMALRPLGKDGLDRTVYAGNCEVHDEDDAEVHNTMFVCCVFRENGTLYAANYWETMAEAVKAGGIAIAKRRKAYGTGMTKPERFTTYTSGTNVEGFNQEAAS